MLDVGAKLKRLLVNARDKAAKSVEDADGLTLPQGVAAQLYCERRRRAAWFSDDLFWEPAWDLLLYLYDASEAGRATVPIDRALQACAAVSEESARRWIHLLTTHDYVTEVAQPGEAGSPRIGMTKRGCEVMTGYLQESRMLAKLS